VCSYKPSLRDAGSKLRFDHRHLLGASGHPLGTDTSCRAVGCLQRFVPSHIHMELVMYKIDLASYALTAGRTFGSPESVKLVRLRERRTFALSDRYKCRNAVYNQISKSLGTNLRFVPSPCQYNPYRLRQKIGDFLSSINNNYANEKY